MKHFTLDINNNIMNFDTAAEAKTYAATQEAKYFYDMKTLIAATKGWTSAEYLALWNTLPGVEPQTKLHYPLAAILKRLGLQPKLEALLQSDFDKQLAITPTKQDSSPVPAPRKKRATKAATISTPKAAVKKPAASAKPAKKAKRDASAGQEVAREGSKKAQVIALLRQPGGATLEEIMERFGWLSHTTRAMMSAGGSLAKAGLKVKSFKTATGERAFKIA